MHLRSDAKLSTKVASSYYDLWREENFTQYNHEDNEPRELHKEQEVWLKFVYLKLPYYCILENN